MIMSQWREAEPRSQEPPQEEESREEQNLVKINVAQGPDSARRLGDNMPLFPAVQYGGMSP